MWHWGEMIMGVHEEELKKICTFNGVDIFYAIYKNELKDIEKIRKAY